MDEAAAGLGHEDEPCGEISVGKPETSGSTMNKFTTYLVSGSLGSEYVFSTRKRYSDFEWLRKTLIAHFPGVLVPPLPRKQRTGRFEEAFIEARRVGLEEFLLRCFRRHELALGSPLMRSFLQAQEPAMEELKKGFEKRPLEEMCREYKVAFARELRTLETPLDDSRLVHCRGFLDVHLGHLRELTAALKEAADAQRTAIIASAAAQKCLAGVCGDESGVLADAQAIEQPRVVLLAALRQQGAVFEDAPAFHYDVLLASAERELDEAEAMQEGLVSLEALQQILQNAKKRVDSCQKKLCEGGDQPSSFGNLFGRKDRDTQVGELRRDLEKSSEEAVLAEEWYLAARTVAIGQQLGSFLSTKVEAHRLATESFAQKSCDTAQRLTGIWTGLVPSRPAEADA